LFAAPILWLYIYNIKAVVICTIPKTSGENNPALALLLASFSDNTCYLMKLF
jgi:hypothetical protein